MRSLKKNLNVNRYRSIGLDTNLFIYYFQRHPHFGPLVREVFRSLSLRQTTQSTSVLTITELLSFKATEDALHRLEHELTTMPFLTIIDVNKDIARHAAKIRRVYGFRFVDAIQLATALHAGADSFITNDKKLTHFKELSVRLLSSF